MVYEGYGEAQHNLGITERFLGTQVTTGDNFWSGDGISCGPTAACDHLGAGTTKLAKPEIEWQSLQYNAGKGATRATVNLN